MDARKMPTDSPRNQNGSGQNELLVISVGTSYPDKCRLTIGAIEAAMEKAFPEYTVCRGFTNQTIISRIKHQDGISIDNTGEALARAAANGVRNLVIQPTHMMDGVEYRKVVTEAAKYQNSFSSLSIGAPLLTSDEDFRSVTDALVSSTAAYNDGETAICFMGHGTEAASNEVYARMQKLLWDSGWAHYFIGTMEAAPTGEDVLAMVKSGNYSRVLLRPMMIVAGGHVNHHMAGEEAGSWKQIFQNAGYEVVCQVRGLGELEAIQNLLINHARAAMGKSKKA